MKIRTIVDVVSGQVACGDDLLESDVEYGFASDLMSDVLTIREKDFVLLTGLANIQSVRTAEMSDVRYLLLCRGKNSSAEMKELAAENGMMIIESPYSLFKCSGLLYEAGLKALY